MTQNSSLYSGPMSLEDYCDPNTQAKRTAVGLKCLSTFMTAASLTPFAIFIIIPHISCYVWNSTINIMDK